MIQELFDVVNEHDAPTGEKTTKEAAHEKGLIHRISAVLVFLPNGKLLVQEHKVWGRKMDHSVGGHVQTNEDYLSAALREMREEISLSVALKAIDVVRPGVKHFESHDPFIRHNYGIFVAEAPKEWRFIANEEVDQLIEMDINEIVALMNSEPEKFLKGFLITMAAFLRATGSKNRIIAYGKDWGKL